MNLKKLAIVLTLIVIAALPSSAQVLYNYETVNYPNDTFTQLLSINNGGVIAGYHGATVNKGFTLVLPNSFTNENFPNSAQTQVVGINTGRHTAGFYVDVNGITHGFIDHNGVLTRV